MTTPAPTRWALWRLVRDDLWMCYAVFPDEDDARWVQSIQTELGYTTEVRPQWST